MLFSQTRLSSRCANTSHPDVELMIDCYLSCFRIKTHTNETNELMKICLHPQSQPLFHFVLVNALYRVITQVWFQPQTFQPCARSHLLNV